MSSGQPHPPPGTFSPSHFTLRPLSDLALSVGRLRQADTHARRPVSRRVMAVGERWGKWWIILTYEWEILQSPHQSSIKLLVQPWAGITNTYFDTHYRLDVPTNDGCACHWDFQVIHSLAGRLLSEIRINISVQALHVFVNILPGKGTHFPGKGRNQDSRRINCLYQGKLQWDHRKEENW